jgi:type I restriction enzyme M protein
MEYTSGSDFISQYCLARAIRLPLYLRLLSKRTPYGKLIDDAMLTIEAYNASLKGVPPKDYNRPALDKVMLGELIDLISGIAMGEAENILGRVYEYFLGGFTGSEGKWGGEFLKIATLQP